MLTLAEKNDYKMAFPAFGTHEEFRIQLMPKGGKGALKFDVIDGTAIEPIEIDGPIVATYEELASESSPFTLDHLLGMGTDILALLGNEGRYKLPLPKEFIDRPISDSVPFSGRDKEMSFTGK